MEQTRGRLYASMNAATDRLSGSKAYSDRCKECLVDMIKASKLRGRAGIPGLVLPLPCSSPLCWRLLGASLGSLLLSTSRLSNCCARHDRYRSATCCKGDSN